MARKPQDRQRVRDAASVLPFAATLLLMPPLITLFAGSGDGGGVPLIVVYVFAVWAAIIVAAFVLAWRLGRDDADRQPKEPPGDGTGR